MTLFEKKKSFFSFSILPSTRWQWIRLIVLLGVPTVVAVTFWWNYVRMPGSSYNGKPSQFSTELQSIRQRLESDVWRLCSPLGMESTKPQVRNQRNMRALRAAEEIIKQSFVEAGYTVQVQEYLCLGKLVRNFEVEVLGTTHSEQIIVVGAHYDGHIGPAADDNASGTAGVLELARYFVDKAQPYTLRFVTFVNEEPPYFKIKGKMGSEVYASRSRERGELIKAMISLEMIGYYSDAKGSQMYPAPLNYFYPSTGNFIAFVGTTKNGALVRQCLKIFRDKVDFPSEGAAMPARLPGIDFSDHWSFDLHNYPAIMITDTAFYRNNNYHLESDTPDTLNYNSMARVVQGLRHVVQAIAKPD